MEKKIVALCTSRIYDPQVQGYIQLINERLKTENTALMIFTINSDLYWNEVNISSETAVFDFIPYDLLDAIVIMDEKIKCHTISEKIIKLSKENNIPVIIVDGYYENLLHVNFDYAAGFELVVRHVFETCNVKKPHMMAGIPNNPFSDARIEVFKRVAQEYGFKVDDSMISYGQFWAVPAREATEKLIASGNVPDAIICANDIMAINVCDVLQGHGLSIPKDVVVTGFDGYDEVFITNPKITTASCTTQELAGATVEMILKVINSDGNENAQISDISVAPVLIPNESTGCSTRSGYDRFMLNRFNNLFYRHNDATRLMYEIGTRMQTSHTPNEMVGQLTDLVLNDENLMDDALFILNKKLFDIDNYFFDREKSDTKIEDYCMVYDGSISQKLKDRRMKNNLMNFENERFVARLEKGYPLIFNSLDFMNSSMGYICYDYTDYDITKYSQTANITNTISIGVGGYINMRYQNRLTERIDNMYKMDPLTGLYNRVGFNNVYERIREKQDMFGQPVTVIMSDLDGLKYINDNFGHAEGDNAIATAAKALKDACPDKAICVRFGGDELFSVIIGECEVEEIIEKIEFLLDEYNQFSNKEYAVLASCGVNTSVFDEDFDIKDALKIADEQMYNIKKAHRKDTRNE